MSEDKVISNAWVLSEQDNLANQKAIQALESLHQEDPVQDILNKTKNLTEQVLDYETNRVNIQEYVLQTAEGKITISFENATDMNANTASVQVTMPNGESFSSSLNKSSIPKRQMARCLEYIIYVATTYQSFEILNQVGKHLIESYLQIVSTIE